MPNVSLPTYVKKYFWGDNIEELSLENNNRYIIQTILNIGDLDAVKWLFFQVPREVVKEKLPQLKLTKQSANFWKIYLS